MVPVEYFGDALLSDSIKPTIVTTFDLTTAQPFFLNSAKAVRNVGDDFLMWQAARATTAVPDALLAHVSPIGWEHINLTGDYTWQSNRRVAQGRLRPLRPVRVPTTVDAMLS